MYTKKVDCHFGAIVMLAVTPGMKVYVAIGSTDMRKSINGLSQLVEDYFQLDLFSGSLFAFCNRRKDRVKIINWDRNGFCLYAEFSIKAVMSMF